MIGDRLRELREERGMKQEDLASIINVERQSISNYENDKSCPSLENLVRLADFFEVTTDYLLGRTKERNFQESKLVYELSKLLQKYGK